MLVALVAVALTVGAAAFCALTLLQSRSIRERDNRLADDLIESLNRNEAAYADMAVTLAELDGAIQAAIDAVTYPAGADELHSRSNADIAQWTALADNTSPDLSRFRSWAFTLNAPTAGDARRWLESQANYAVDHRPHVTKMERTQRAWRANASTEPRGRLVLPEVWLEVELDDPESAEADYDAKDSGLATC